MKYNSSIPNHHHQVTKIVDTEEVLTRGAMIDNEQRCVVFPTGTSMVAEVIERRNQNWIVQTKAASDLVIKFGDSSFHLHKLPMVSRSKYLNRLIFERSSHETKDQRITNIQIDNLPGGTMTFELVVKFCYGWKLHLSPSNIAPLYSAAHFLEMSDDLAHGNLVTETESFLNFLILSSWKDTFKILKSCESISVWPKTLRILERCTETIAFKAFVNPQSFSFSGNDETEKPEGETLVNNWWFDDVSQLRIDHFVEVIEYLKKKGMRSEVLGSCIANWSRRCFSKNISRNDRFTPTSISHQTQIVTIESLIKLIPIEENSVSCSFMLHILKVGLMKKIDSELVNKLERRIALEFEKCRPPDILIKNYGENESTYDVNLVTRVVKSYVSNILGNHQSKLFALGRLVDGYLTLVARDEKLKLKIFQSLLEVLPENARYCNDNLYQAIDMYLKAHPHVTEEERNSLCRSLEYHRLSQEAQKHVMKNNRLPVKITARFILSDQVNMIKSITAAKSAYKQTKTQTIMRVSKCLVNDYSNTRNEIKMMKKEVETMKMQLNDLQMCKIRLKRQVKGCIH